MTDRPWSPSRSSTRRPSAPCGNGLDTGFTGYLTLPEETIRQLGLSSVGRRTFELANGELFEFEAYLASVSWHGRLTDALVLRSGSEPLLGMTLLWGSRVTLDAIAQGAVRIELLEAVAPETRASKDTPPIVKRLLGRLWDFVKNSSLAMAFGIVGVVGIGAFAFGVDSLPLDFGEVLTFMGVWLAIGVLLGQNKPPAMPLKEYLPRRIFSSPGAMYFSSLSQSYMCYYATGASLKTSQGRSFGVCSCFLS